MYDEVRDDLDQRLKCVRGHLQATARMVECGEDDLAIAHQIQAVRGALTQIQVRLLRVWISECGQQRQQPDTLKQIERDLSAILKVRRRPASTLSAERKEAQPHESSNSNSNSNSAH